MKKILIAALLLINIPASYGNINSTDTLSFHNGYSQVNGIKMYYEIYGEGKPIVLLHGGGSTIQSTFGRVTPLLAKHRKVIGVEL